MSERGETRTSFPIGGSQPKDSHSGVFIMSVERLELSTNGLKARNPVFTLLNQETTVFDPVRWTKKLKSVGILFIFSQQFYQGCQLKL
ncbi:MAG TPA: hypothetical protein VII93_07320, partial [Anaerolineales bacterium]